MTGHAILQHMGAFAFGLVVMSMGRSSFAQTTNYQDRPLGTRGLAMAGAETASSEDATASYYNPAGVGDIRQKQLELSLPIIGLGVQNLSSGLITQASQHGPTDSIQTLSIPSSIAAQTSFGPKDSRGLERYSLSISFLTPTQSQLSFQQAIPDGTNQGLHSQTESQTTVMAGTAFAIHLHDYSLGASIFYVHQTFSYQQERSGVVDTCHPTCGHTGTYDLSTLESGFTGGLNLRLGALYHASSQWRLGAMVSLSSLRVLDGATLQSERQETGAGGISQTIVYKTGGSDQRLPFELRLGAAFRPHRSWVLAFDVSFYAPDNYQPIINAQNQGIFYPDWIKRNFVANFSFGLEYYFRKGLPVRAGVFSNFSAANSVSIDPKNPGVSIVQSTRGCEFKACEPYVNNFGLTGSVGVQVERVALNFGLNLTYGSGYYQNVASADASRFLWSTYQQGAIIAFVGGDIGKVIVGQAEQISERVLPPSFLAATSQPSSNESAHEQGDAESDFEGSDSVSGTEQTIEKKSPASQPVAPVVSQPASVPTKAKTRSHRKKDSSASKPTTPAH